MKRTLIEITILVGLGLIFGYIMFEYPPVPPAGVCDENGSAEKCNDWCQDMMERL